MPKKCETCRHFFNDPDLTFQMGVCGNQLVLGVMVESAVAIDINAGRKICDREADGIFVYFEPIEPEPAVGELPGTQLPSAALPLVQITRERSAPATQPDDWRKIMHQEFRTAGGAF